MIVMLGNSLVKQKIILKKYPPLLSLKTFEPYSLTPLKT